MPWSIPSRPACPQVCASGGSHAAPGMSGGQADLEPSAAQPGTDGAFAPGCRPTAAVAYSSWPRSASFLVAVALTGGQMVRMTAAL